MVACGLLSWKLRIAHAALGSDDREIYALRADLRRAVQRASASSQRQPRREPKGTLAKGPTPHVDVLAQLQTLDWGRKRKMGFLTIPFNPAGTFDFGLATRLGLTADEFDRLNAAIQQTKRRYDELAIGSATAHLSEDGKTLEVSVPSLFKGTSDLYSGLLKTFSDVLGPDRMQLFNAIAGSSFDNSFDRFGLNQVTYELTLQPIANDGSSTTAYKIARAWSDGTTNGWGTSNWTLDDIKSSYPVVGHFLSGSTDGQIKATGIR